MSSLQKKKNHFIQGISIYDKRVSVYAGTQTDTLSKAPSSNLSKNQLISFLLPYKELYHPY